MTFIASHLFLWLAIMVVSGGLSLFLQIRNMTKTVQTIAKSTESMNEQTGLEDVANGVGKAASGYLTRMIPIFFLAAAASISGVLVVISTVLHIIAYTNGN